jgi:elongation factor Ts
VLSWFLYSLWKQNCYFSSLSAVVEGAEEAARNVAMQAAAMSPIALKKKVLMLQLSKKIEIAKDLLRQKVKPEAMLDNIAKGKLAL